jgi:hypothetical protein
MDPLLLVTSTLGPLAALESRQRPEPGEIVVPNSWNVRRRADGRLAVRDVLLFGPFNIDPDDYDRWVDRLAANMRVAPDLVK